MSKVALKPFTKKDRPLLDKWAKKKYVQKSWFQERDITVDETINFSEQSSYNYPYLIEYEGVPIGFLLYCQIEGAAKSSFTPIDGEKAYSFHLFIGEETYLDSGIGTETVKALITLLFDQKLATAIYTDPNKENGRAIRCFEKAGFKKMYTRKSKIGTCQVMRFSL